MPRTFAGKNTGRKSSTCRVRCMGIAPTPRAACISMRIASGCCFIILADSELPARPETGLRPEDRRPPAGGPLVQILPRAPHRAHSEAVDRPVGTGRRACLLAVSPPMADRALLPLVQEGDAARPLAGTRAKRHEDRGLLRTDRLAPGGAVEPAANPPREPSRGGVLTPRTGTTRETCGNTPSAAGCGDRQFPRIFRYIFLIQWRAVATPNRVIDRRA